MHAWISTRMDQFSYFDRQLGHPDWAHADVLDFGGNNGNLLLDPDCTIDPARYWCLDVVRAALEQGRQGHPLAHFELYDRYNFEFNPTGTPGLPIPDLGRRFDYIVSYAVFAHTSKAEMRELVEQLLPMLADGGALAFTFIDPYFDPPEGWLRDWEPQVDNLTWRLSAGPIPDRVAAEVAAHARGSELTWATLVNNEDLVLESGDDWIRMGDERSQYIAFCTEEHMRSIFPGAEVLPPVPPERHSCCVIRTPSPIVHSGPSGGAPDGS
jgi:hypothetical protein